jgi:hypothetical protein
MCQAIKPPVQDHADDSANPYPVSDVEAETDPSDSLSPARKNWQRAVSAALQASGDGGSSVDQEGHVHPDDYTDLHTPTCPPKTMGLEYFLEMVDSKHRHGSNLRAYHAAWKNSPSSQNFFYWLDHGEGKDFELPQCTREQLEKDQVRYLSPEERFNYLVNVDDVGLLRWAKNNELVDTDNKRYKDSVHGVIRVDENIPKHGAPSGQDSVTSPASAPTSSGQLSSSIIPGNERKEDQVLSTQEDHEFDKAVNNFSRIRPVVIYDHFAGSLSIKDGMWIFVSDHTNNIKNNSSITF